MYIMVRNKGDNMNKIYKNLSNHVEKKSAFTLAEVLITLGIIGVVAALTIPNLVNNYQKHQTAIKLKRFASILRQADKMRQKDQMLGYIEELNSAEVRSYNGADELKYFNRYFAPYIRTTSVVALSKGVLVKLPDGTGMYFLRDCATDNVFVCQNIMFCTEAKYCDAIDSVATNKGQFLNDRRHIFFFWKEGPANMYSTRDSALNACKSSSQNYKGCAQVIELDEWQIKDDYPW